VDIIITIHALRLQGSQQLHALHGNGIALSMPEDDKMWSMLESSYQTLEFHYAPNAQQVRHLQSVTVFLSTYLENRKCELIPGVIIFLNALKTEI
jgi:hypothetical protein